MRPTASFFIYTYSATEDSRLRGNDEMQISPLRATLKMTKKRSWHPATSAGQAPAEKIQLLLARFLRQ